MSWASNLQDASFRGVPFEVMSVTDDEGRALVRSRYPYRNGAELADMGLEAKEIVVHALIKGDSYEADLDRLMDALRESGPGDLIHPVIGAVTVQAFKWRVDHTTDIVDGCVLVITFVEDGLLAPVFSKAVVDEADEITAEADIAEEEICGAFQDAIEAAGVLDGLPDLNALQDALQTAMGTLQDALSFSPLQAILSELDPLAFPLAWASDFIAVIDRALQGLPFGGFNELYDTAAGNPTPAASARAAAAAGGSAGAVLLASSTGGASAADSGAAARTSVAIALLQPMQLQDFHAVQRALAPTTQTLPPSTNDGNAVKSIPGLVARDRSALQAFIYTVCAGKVSQAAAIVLTAEPQQRALAPADIERVAALTRYSLQAAITAVRGAYRADVSAPIVAALKAQAVAVQDLALAAVRLRPPLVTKLAPVGGHWRLVAHQFYGDATRAPELMRLNSWGRNVLVKARQEVRAYAR